MMRIRIGRCHKEDNNAHIMDWSAMHCTAFRSFKTPLLNKMYMYKELSKILIAAHCLEPSNGCSRPYNTRGKKIPTSINRDNCSSFVFLSRHLTIKRKV